MRTPSDSMAPCVVDDCFCASFVLQRPSPAAASNLNVKFELDMADMAFRM